MSPLERITKRVSRLGDVNDRSTPRPLLTLEEFFEGNEYIGSICCNCNPPPKPGEMYELLKRIGSRPDVAEMRVEVSMFDVPEWPFSETVWVITSADPDSVKAWFPEAVAPDECWAGWTQGVLIEPLTVPNGMQAVACWWD